MKGDKAAADPIIRVALPGDIPAMCDLFPPVSDREKKAEVLSGLMEQSTGSSALFVAVRECRVLGLCSIHADFSAADGRPAGIVDNLTVHRDFQGQGIGESLLGSVMTWCANLGITRMQLPERDDAPALQFYFSRSWTGSICLKNGF